jgi:hypothetical protein
LVKTVLLDVVVAVKGNLYFGQNGKDEVLLNNQLNNVIDYQRGWI